jgi:flagellar motor switch protein FliN/FliY
MANTTEEQPRRGRRGQQGMSLQNLEDRPMPPSTPERERDMAASAADLEPVYDVPVTVSAVLGRSRMEVSDLLAMDSGQVIELDRKVGEAVDIFVNGRLIARGEVVLVEGKLGVTMTEIIRPDR